MRFIYIYLILTILAILSFIYYVLNVYYAEKYRPEISNKKPDISEATVLIPVYNEDENIFRNVLRSVKSQGVKFVVVGDACNEPYKSITEEYGGKFILLEQHGGKRAAMVEGIKHINTKYVMFLDSDTELPDNAVYDVLKYFNKNVGGVSVNIRIRNNGNKISYASEFIERTREIVFRAMSYHGSIMIAVGNCATYKTGIIKPFLLSDEFKNKHVMGRKTVLGDDIQITSYLIKNGYKVVKDYNVTVETSAQDNFKKFIHQQIRWAKNGWYYFFKNLSNGTTKKAGWFYAFNVLYLYIVPVAGFLLLLYRLYFMTIHFGYYDSLTLHRFLRHIMFQILPLELTHKIRDPAVIFYALNKLFIDFLGIAGNSIFVMAVMARVPKERLRTISYGALGILIMFFANLYGLLTFWKQSKWATR